MATSLRAEPRRRKVSRACGRLERRERWVPGFMMAALVASWLCVSPSAQARRRAPPAPVVLEAPRVFASPVGAIRWMHVDDKSLAVSDLAQGIAAIDTASGRVLWHHSAFKGRVDRIWVVHDRIVAAGHGLEVIDRADGRVAWRRKTGCTSRIQCVERVHSAGPEGVLISGTGRVHTELGLLGLRNSQTAWPQAQRVSHPARVLLLRDRFVSQDANAPFALRFFDRDTGAPIGRWAWSAGPHPVQPKHLLAQADGSVVAIDLDSTVGYHLARIAIVAPDGTQRASRLVARGIGVDGRARWLDAIRGSLWVLGQDREGPWLARAALDKGSADLVVRGQLVDEPLVLRSQVVVHHHDGKALVVAGYDGATGERLWQHRILAPARSGRWFDLGGRALLVLDDQDAPVLLFDPVSGYVVGLGELQVAGRDVTAVGEMGDTLYVAAGKSVYAHALASFADRTAQLREAIQEGRVDDARAMLRSVSLAASMVPEARALQRRLVQGQAEALLREASKRAANHAAVVGQLADMLASPRRGIDTILADLVHPIGVIVGSNLVGKVRSPDRPTVAALERLGGQLVSGVRRVGHAFHGTGDHAAHQVALRNACVLVSAALLAGGQAAVAADLMAAWTQGDFDNVAGMEPLYRAAAAVAVAQMARDLATVLRGAEARGRKEAAKMIRETPHVAVVTDRATVKGLLEKVEGTNKRAARAAGKKLGNYLLKAAKAAKKELGTGLGEPGCLATCRTLGTICPHAGYGARSCASEQQRCTRGCRRGNPLRWSPP